jgi:anthranilate synthase component 2
VIARPRLLMIDNDDSFTFMLVDQLRMAGGEVRVVRASDTRIQDALDQHIDGVVISPGPGHPAEAISSIAIARACIDAEKPLLGVCLGHQVIALACGGTIERVAPVHGKSLAVHHEGAGLFAALPSPFYATRYHSLATGVLHDELVDTAWSDDGTVMALQHRSAPAYGVQFHPESIASDCGQALLQAFTELVRIRA